MRQIILGCRAAMVCFAFVISVRDASADMFLIAHSYFSQYDERSGELLQTGVRGFNGETIECTTFGPDGDIYASIQRFGGSSVQRFDGRNLQFKDVLVPFNLGLPCGLQFGPDGDLLVAWMQWVGSREEERSSVYRFDVKTATLKSKFIDSDYSIKGIASMAIGADGNVYLVEDPKGLVIYDGKTADVLRTIAPPELPSFGYADELAFGKDQSLYWLHKNLYRVDLESGAHTKVVDLEASGVTNVFTMAIGPEGDFYFVDGAGDTVRFDGKTGGWKGVVARHPNFDLGYGYTGLLFSGPRLWMTQAASASGGALRYTDTKDNFVIESNAAIGDSTGWIPVDLSKAINRWPDVEIGVSNDDAARIFRLRRR